MKCIVCDRCKTIIENPRRCRVITCARPLKPRTTCEKGKTQYRGNDPQQNDILWEKEICDKCLDELEAFFEAHESAEPHPPAPEEPDPDIPPDPGGPGGDDNLGGGEEPPITGGEPDPDCSEIENPPDPGDGGEDGEGAV